MIHLRVLQPYFNWILVKKLERKYILQKIMGRECTSIESYKPEPCQSCSESESSSKRSFG